MLWNIFQASSPCSVHLFPYTQYFPSYFLLIDWFLRLSMLNHTVILDFIWKFLLTVFVIQLLLKYLKYIIVHWLPQVVQCRFIRSWYTVPWIRKQYTPCPGGVFYSDPTHTKERMQSYRQLLFRKCCERGCLSAERFHKKSWTCC